MEFVTTFWFNSLTRGKFEWNFMYVIFKWILVIYGLEIALIWMSLDFTNDRSTLVQVMAWCCQATSHYLSQCWPRSLLQYGVTRPEWVKTLSNVIHSWVASVTCDWIGLAVVGKCMPCIFVNFGSGNGLLPDGNKPLPQPVLVLWQVRSQSTHLDAHFYGNALHFSDKNVFQNNS